MLDKNIQKYITLVDSNIVSAQDTKTKEWFCKELPCKTVEETEEKINELNRIYNKFNTEIKKQQEKDKK